MNYNAPRTVEQNSLCGNNNGKLKTMHLCLHPMLINSILCCQWTIYVTAQ